MTAAGWVGHLSELRTRVPGAAPEPPPIVVMLGMVSFLLLIGAFGYTDTSGDKEMARFPRRLFILPLSSLRLATVPVVAGIAAVELFYVFWREPLSRGEPTSPVFTGLLLAAFMVMFQTVLWTLDRAGALRIVAAGAVGILMLGANLLPLLPPSPPPWWRSESGLAVIAVVLAIAGFLVSWRRIDTLRTGGGETANWFDAVRDRIAEAMPGRQRPFPSPAAARFWFEWRTGGTVLPALVAGAIVVAIGPLSWNARGSGTDTMRLLLFALATPIVLALPVGMAASKPRFWSEDLSIPAFLAVHPLTADDIVAVKVRVAAASAATAWAVLLTFAAVWLSLRANLHQFSPKMTRRDVPFTALAVACAVMLTWRMLVSRLSSGLSGSRRWFTWSVVSLPLTGLAALMFDASGLVDWLWEDAARLRLVAIAAGFAVVAKGAFAAYAWRTVPARHLRAYLLAWAAGTALFMSLGIAIWKSAHPDASRAGITLAVLILSSLLVLPLGRVGLAPSRFARNRHR
jgi:hypothetical protein